MKFMVDESTGTAVVRFLRSEGHDVLSVFDDFPGAEDRHIFTKADAEGRILITNDKDFGELVFREGKPHYGVILLRLENESPDNRIRMIKNILERHPDRLKDHFSVVTEKGIRIRSIRGITSSNF